MTTITAWRRVAATTMMLMSILALSAMGTARAQDEADETGPGEEAPADLGVVHSWALAPAGAGDGSQPGDRADLTYEMAPGTQLEDAVTLFNLSNVPLTFDIYATDARNNPDGAFAPFGSDEQSDSVGAWVTLPFDRIEVPPGQQATLPITVDVPADAQPGDHAGAILAASAALGTGADGRVVNLDRRTGTRVYIRVDGPLQPELAVADLRTTYEPSLNPLSGTAVVSYRIENRGNVRMSGTYRPSVSGPFGLLETPGQTVELAELLPGESVDATQTFENVAATGLAFTEVELEATPIRGDADDVQSSSRSSVALAVPFSVVALLLVAGLVWYARKAYQRHRREELLIDDRFAGGDIFTERQPT